jgi:acetylornithine/succinyldiaminopimelate/putrescine aminotransferase/predicted amino acid dehydrogenase
MPDDDSQLYRRFLKPELGRLLAALKLDVTYHKGRGDLLWWRDETGKERQALDFLGGYGASLFGHNHPRLVETMCSALRESRVFNAQKSCRASAGKLAQRLSDLVGSATSQSYVTTLTNSGAEAVEAALKHATLAYNNRCEDQRRGFVRTVAKTLERWRRGELRVAPGLMEEARRHLPGLTRVSDLTQLAELMIQTASEALGRPPLFVSLDHGFHGLTTGAVQITAGLRYRAAFQGLGAEALLLPEASEEALRTAVQEASVDLPEFGVVDGEIRFLRRPWSKIAAVFVEPLQGEGGIRSVSPEFLRSLRGLADASGFVVVFDEIQSGMGRTGTFLFCEQIGVVPDYILLSKSLGGGLTKLGALLVDRRLYCDEFSLMHSSTFAEDDLSAGVALEALALLTSDGLMERCREIGEFAKAELSALASRHPDVIEAARGTGLMLGIGLKDFRYCSSLPLQMLAQQEMLGYVVSGYLLHEHGVRVGPTLSHAGTIRIEPSAYVSREQIYTLVQALDALCHHLGQGDVSALVKYLIPDDESGPATVLRPADEAQQVRPRIEWNQELPRTSPTLDELPQVAFLAHFASADDLVDWERSFGKLSHSEREKLLDCMHDVVEPMVHDRTVIGATTGRAVCMNVIGLCIDARLMSRYVRGRDRRVVMQHMQQAVELAESLGCGMIGLGGYTSIVSGNGMLLKSDRAGLTTGNSLTVGMGLASIRRSAEFRGVSLASARFAAVGAAGNIASIYSEMISDQVSAAHLLGRTQLNAVEEVAGKILRRACATALAHIQDKGPRPAGVAAALLDKRGLALLRAGALPDDNGKLFRLLASELGSKCPVTVGSDFAALESADVILSASNSPQHVIFPEMIGEQPTIICDISVPPDADPRITELRPNTSVIQGGVVKMPKNPDYHPPGSPLPAGRCYACVAETTLLGLEGIRENFSYGMITRERVLLTMELADKHGFSLAETELKGYNQFSRNIEQVA